MATTTKKVLWLRRLLVLGALLVVYFSLQIYYSSISGQSMNQVEFRLPANLQELGVQFEPTKIYVSGYFNAWAADDPAHRMDKMEDGSWYGVVKFIPGENQYKYAMHHPDGETVIWIPDPTNENNINDNMGGQNSVINLPDYQAIWEMVLFGFLIVIALYGVYLLIDGISNLIFSTGLGQRAKFFVLVWFIVLLTFGINTLRSWDQQVSLIKIGLDDSINLIHRFFTAEGVNWTSLTDDEEVSKFQYFGRGFFYGARILVRENAFTNDEVRFDEIILLDDDFNVLGFLNRAEGLPETHRLKQRLGIFRTQDFLERAIFSPHIEAGKIGKYPLGKTIYEKSSPEVLGEKDFGYNFATNLLGFNAFLKPIFQGTTIVGYYGVSIQPNTLIAPLQEAFIYNGLLALLISLFLAVFFFSQKRYSSYDGYLLDRFIQRYKLSPREQEITRYLYLGYSNPEIAKKLNISQGTVKTHIYHVFKKAGASQRIELIQCIQDME
jgi:DNA-binding CsgD family transcriptional regulator